MAVVFRLLNGLPDGQRLKSAGGFPSEYISFGQEQTTIKNETREGKQSRCLSKSSSFPDLSPYSGDRARQKLPRGQSNDLVPRYFERKVNVCENRQNTTTLNHVAMELNGVTAAARGSAAVERFADENFPAT